MQLELDLITQQETIRAWDLTESHTADNVTTRPVRKHFHCWCYADSSSHVVRICLNSSLLIFPPNISFHYTTISFTLPETHHTYIHSSSRDSSYSGIQLCCQYAERLTLFVLRSESNLGRFISWTNMLTTKRPQRARNMLHADVKTKVESALGICASRTHLTAGNAQHSTDTPQRSVQPFNSGIQMSARLRKCYKDEIRPVVTYR